jgi:hypothetical protein
MTHKVYKSAMGKTVDLGALLLQNEQVRAVGNMSVNAAGDTVDGANRVIDQRNRQVQRQYKRQTNVGTSPIADSNLSARKMQQDSLQKEQPVDLQMDLSMNKIVAPTESGGLAGAMARSQELKQESQNPNT